MMVARFSICSIRFIEFAEETIPDFSKYAAYKEEYVEWYLRLTEAVVIFSLPINYEYILDSMIKIC